MALSRRVIRRISISIASVALALILLLGAAVAFGVARPPAPLPDVANAISKLDITGLPPVSHYPARDGSMLAYRAYPGNGRQVAILLHGSAGQSPQVHVLARTLNRSGITVYAPDIRGHGDSGHRGDIDYIGQLDDDLAEFMAYVRPSHSGATYTLMGFSAGGAFTLRIAGGRFGNLFDRYIAISPALGFPGGVARPGNGGWAAVSIPRISALVVLNHVGLHHWDGLDAVHFAAPDGNPFFTRIYSYRLAMNFSPGLDYLSALAHVTRPVAVIAGADDPQFDANGYAPLLKPVKPDIQIELVPGVKHVGALLAPPMLDAIQRVFLTMP